MANSGDGNVVISVRGLKTQFGRNVIHEHLDLDVYRGEIIGVVGASGSGKSVLLRSIVGLLKPVAGRVQLFGRDMSSMTFEERTRLEQRWGVLFQDGALFSSLTVAQTV